MKVVVAVKEVSIVEDIFEVDGQTIPEKYVSSEMNEWDSYALEAAVQFSETTDEDVEIVTVTIGPENSEETIRQALAKGADRAIRVWDEKIAETQTITHTTRARLLEAVAVNEDPDFILTGVQSGDLSFGATGVTLASRLDYEWAAVVTDLDIDIESGDATVHRELEGGMEEVTDIVLPAVFTIQTGINEPRYASMRGIRQAQSKPLEVYSLADLNLDESVLKTPVEQVNMEEPESESEATIWSGDASTTSADLSELLREEGVIEG